MTPTPEHDAAPRAAASGEPAGPGATARRVGVATRVLWRVHRSRGRLVLAVAVITALGLAALLLRVAGAGRGATVGLLDEGALGLAVPVVTLVLAVACLGELRDDGTLGYVWRRPVRRGELAVAAWLTATGRAAPFSATTVAVMAVAAGRLELLVPAAVAAVLGSAGYAALFVALGLRTQRSLLWGFAYVLLLESFLVRFSEQLATVSVRRYAASVFRDLAGTTGGSPLHQVSLTAGVVGIAAAVLLGVGLTTWWLRTRPVP